MLFGVEMNFSKKIKMLGGGFCSALTWLKTKTKNKKQINKSVLVVKMSFEIVMTYEIQISIS